MLQDQLNALLVDSTENHPKVKELREQITRKKAELEKDKLEFTEDIMLDEKTTNPIIEEIKKGLDNMEYTTVSMNQAINASNPDKDIYKVMLMEKLDSAMARDVGVNTSIYNMLLQRLETAKITQRLQSSKEGTRYTILDPPRVPLRPFQPKKIFMALLGLFLGGLAGTGLVIMSELFDKSFLDVQEAKEHLGVPLLGAISKINTEASIRHDQERQSWVYSITFLVGIIMIIITTAIANFLK